MSEIAAVQERKNEFRIEKINTPKYLNLKERLETFYKKPIDEIYVESVQEVSVGGSVGEEFW